MKELECIFLENEIAEGKALCEYNIALSLFKNQAKHANALFENTEYNFYMEGAGKTLGDSVTKFITRVIDMIKSLFNKISSVFSKDEKSDKIKKAESILEKNPSADKGKKVEVIVSKEEKNAINEYIREMAKLERKALNLKTISGGPHFDNDTLLQMNHNEIMKEMQLLNDRFDKQLLSKHNKVIQMGLKDAIRFNDKELDSIKVDFNEVEKESERILQLFKKDANGIEHPVKKNLIQKIAQNLGTRVRQYCKKRTEIRKKNFAVVTLAVAPILTFMAVARNPWVQQAVSSEINRQFPGAMDKVREKMDKINAEVQKRASQARSQPQT